MAKREPQKGSKSGNITSNVKLAAECGVTRGSVDKWRKHTDWSFGGPPWKMATVAKIKNWQATTLRPDYNKHPDAVEPIGPISDAMRQAKLMLTLERAAAVKLDRLIKEGQYLKRADVDRGRVQRIYQLKADFGDMARRLPAKLSGMSEREMEPVIWAAVATVLNVYAEGKP